MSKNSFEVKLGRLEATFEAKEEVSMFLSFECYATGKLFELQMNQDDIMKSNKLFAYDVLCVGDILKERPGITVAAGDEHVVVNYTVTFMNRVNNIRFVIMPKQYPEGSNEEVFELKRQMRLQDRKILELTKLIQKNMLVESSRQMISVPDNNLLVKNSEAHQIMMNQEYDYLDEKKYAAFVESKSNTTIEKMVEEFLPNQEDKYLFNLHYLNRNQGWQFISCPLGDHKQLEAIESRRRCTFHLSNSLPMEEEYLSFIKVDSLHGSGLFPQIPFSQKVHERKLFSGLNVLHRNSQIVNIELKQNTMFIIQKLAPQNAGAPPPYPSAQSS